jgi:hypothetical protein
MPAPVHAVSLPGRLHLVATRCPRILSCQDAYTMAASMIIIVYERFMLW